MEWKTIESAPQDDEIAVLVFNGKVSVAGRFGGDWWALANGDHAWDGQEIPGGLFVWPEPTHWMPLPSPPSVG